MSTPALEPRAALEQLLACEAWAVIRTKDAATVTLVGGRRSEAGSLTDVPLERGAPPPGRRYDRLLAVPFRQVRERGFEAHDDGAPLVVVEIDVELEVPREELLAALPAEEVALDRAGGFETSDEDYAEVVRRIIDDEIGNGEGANLVVAGTTARVSPTGGRPAR